MQSFINYNGHIYIIMDTYKVKWTKMQSEIFKLLCIKAGETLNLRETAKLLKKTPTAVSNALPDLKKEGLIRVEKSRAINLLSIQFNRDNFNAVDMKRTENLRLIYESGLAEFLKENFPGCAVMLFGSYSRGEDTTSSDIDMAIIGTKQKELDTSMFEKMLERKISLNFYSSFKKIHKHLLNNILSGILLSGVVEL